ncbi:exonuclease [Natrarchaeobaculum aegyptiacum]|uniref:Exonuclease n=1 Tax=Natrarchaeobaculum aegyptiacum TaxID=745377 RepID=A0A2Z2HVF7_9EURY|nr:exonuclease [Natrarchaeobaculum aegyptiacum]ARS91286.1 exonuclease [Natrarchaeobaculum aegyptiacum]
MGADGRTTGADASADGESDGSVRASVAADLERAGFVQFVVRADGDALAASGILTRVLSDRGTPFQVTVGGTIAERTERAQAVADGGADADLTLSIGATDAAVTRLDASDRPATLAAVEVTRALDSSSNSESESSLDPVLALAGLVAAGVEPGAGESEWLLETADERGLLERRPGVVMPTSDPVDGLAHSTRIRAPWSGDPDATAEALAEVDVDTDADLDAEGDADATEDDHRAIGSLVALDVVGGGETAPRAADSIARALKPYATPQGPFATLGGYADVLEATARLEPGTGAALAMGHGAREQALAVWRRHGRQVHEALEAASTGRYDGLFVVGVDDAPVASVADLAAAFLSPEPAVLATGAGEAAIVTVDEPLSAGTVERIARDLEEATDGSDVAYDVAPRSGTLRFDAEIDDAAVIEHVRAVR